MRNLLVALFILSLSSCASVFKGTSQVLNFDSSPQGAEVVIDGQSMGQTPLSVKLKKNKYNTVMFKKKGYKTATRIIETSYDGVAILNIFWDSSTTDLITGAIYQYSPASYFAQMSKPDVSE